jgi:oligo-1,6-glucosidase
MRFWLDKGVDGFRVDTVNMYSKTYAISTDTNLPELPDAEITEPDEETQFASKLFCNGPRIHEFLLEMNDILNEYDVITVGELPNTPKKSGVMSYISARARNLNMVFNFGVVALGRTPGARFATRPYTNIDFKRELSKWQTTIDDTDAWTTVFLENHDQGRSVFRFASDLPQYRVQAATMLALILSTMTGTLFLYQGQEIGMANMPRSWPAEEYKCIKSVNYYNMIRKKTNDDPSALSKTLDGMQLVGRDNARVLVQWDSSPNAGFCSGDAKLWMRVIDNYKEINVADQLGDLEFWKMTLTLRREYKDLFVYGRF